MWNFIVTWFKDRNERRQFVNEFNNAAKIAFVKGETRILLKANISSGNPNYKHAFSKWMAGGFRIIAESGNVLTREDVLNIGEIIIGNPMIVRQMITMGWDTLEIHPSGISKGLQWKLNQINLIE